MECLLGLVFSVLNLLKQVPNCYTLNSIKIEQFQVLNKNLPIATCAIKVIGKSEYIGSLLNEDTEICEELPQSWRANYTYMQGFSYAIKISTKEVFDPMVYVSNEDGYKTWRMPIVFHEGFEMTLALVATEFYRLLFVLTDAEWNPNEDMHIHTIFESAGIGDCVWHCEYTYSFSNSNVTVYSVKVAKNQTELSSAREVYYAPNLKDIQYFTVLRDDIGFQNDYLPEPTPIHSIEFSSRNDLRD